MKKISAFVLVILTSLTFPNAWAKKSLIYNQPNQPYNYVRLEKLKDEKHQDVKANHPYTFNEDTLSDILRSFRYNKRAIWSEQIKTRHVFEEEYVRQFAPILVKAFQEADASEAVVLSVAQKRPYVVIRNDRLTQVKFWVVGKELYADFMKTEVKLEGDYKAPTIGQKMIDNAKGLRISLEPQEGQKFAPNSAYELIVDLNANWVAIMDKIEAQDEKERQEEEAAKKRKRQKKEDRAESKQTNEEKQASKPKTSQKDQISAEKRLEELKRLQEKGLITPEDYERKKSEILQSL